MNCDRLAPFYQWIEKAAFGGALQRHRIAFLAAASGKARALVLGDGDGRFAQTLATSYPGLAIDYVELSAGMVAQARGRLTSCRGVRIIHGDAFRFTLPDTSYDLVYTHFFLDCFSTDKVNILIRRLTPSLSANTAWIISDFKEMRTGWRKVYTGAWLKVMYLFFHYAAGLDTRQLPEYGSALETAGFKLRSERRSSTGLIASELWQR